MTILYIPNTITNQYRNLTTTLLISTQMSSLLRKKS